MCLYRGRRHVAAHSGYNARAIARLVEWAATGVATPMYSSPDAHNQEINFGATLSPIALCSLVEHAAIHLNVEWRDLPNENWGHQVVTAQGRRCRPAKRCGCAREVWLHAVDLDNGATVADIPTTLLERLLVDITGAWKTRGTDTGLILDIANSNTRLGDVNNPDAVPVTGSLPELAAWASGRSSITNAPPAPPWI